jgi:hypothetical protein
VASTCVRTWLCTTAGAPVVNAPTFVSLFRANFEHHPRSIHGAGGASSAKAPICAASNTVGTPAARFTGAK